MSKKRHPSLHLCVLLISVSVCSAGTALGQAGTVVKGISEGSFNTIVRSDPTPGTYSSWSRSYSSQNLHPHWSAGSANGYSYANSQSASYSGGGSFSQTSTMLSSNGFHNLGSIRQANSNARVTVGLTMPRGIPGHWHVERSAGLGGVTYYDPSRTKLKGLQRGQIVKDTYVRLMPGNPQSPFVNSRSAYVRWQKHGRVLDVNGNLLPDANRPEAHIPLEKFKFRPELFQ